jgi:hypothetical protein
MDRESCAAVLVEKLGVDGYSALIAMTEEREDRLLTAIVEGFAAVDRKFEAIDRKFGAVDQKFVDIDRQFLEVYHRFDVMGERQERRLAEETGKLRVEMHDGFGALRAEMHAGFGVLRADMANQRADLMKWALLFWVTQAGAAAAIVAALR